MTMMKDPVKSMKWEVLQINQKMEEIVFVNNTESEGKEDTLEELGRWL